MAAGLDVHTILQHYDLAKGLRGFWDQHWSEVARLVYPDADDFTQKRSPGEKRSREIFDPTAALAVEKFSAAMEGMLTPVNQTYQNMRPSDSELEDDPEIVEWLELLNRRILQMRASPKSGFYNQAHEAYKSLGTFGNQCMYVEEVPGQGIRYKHCAIADVWVTQNHLRQVDTVYFRYRLTAQAVQQRWQEKAPQKAKQAKNPYEPLEFVHVVMPNLEIEPDRLDAAGRAWTSIDLCIDTKEIVETGFFDEMPYIYSRYTLNPGEIYGRSPAMLVLPSIKTLQEMVRTILRAAEKAVDPPLLLRSDAVLGGGARRPRLAPAGLNFGGLDAAGREMIKALVSGSRPELAFELMERERATINDAFLVPLFQAFLEHPNMTATEVLMRAQERAVALGPTLFRQQSEFLGPMNQREAMVMIRQGRVPRAPRRFVESGANYEIEYETMMVRQQRMDEILGLQRTIEIMAPWVSANPSLLELVDPDKAFHRVARLQGVPEDLLRDKEELEQLRGAMAEADESAAAIEAAPAMAKAVAEVSKAGASRLAA